jgi:predicted N-acetyltransferase YhbS
MGINIRNEEEKDIEQVRAIVRAAFPSEAESKLVDTLRANSKAIISLVAVNNNDVLGHILFSPVSTTPPSEAGGVGLAPVAVRPDVQSQGIGSRLIREGCAAVRNVVTTIVLCWAARNIISASGLRRRALLVYAMNTAWITNLCSPVFPIALWRA